MKKSNTMNAKQILTSVLFKMTINKKYDKKKQKEKKIYIYYAKK